MEIQELLESASQALTAAAASPGEPKAGSVFFEVG